MKALNYHLIFVLSLLLNFSCTKENTEKRSELSENLENTPYPEMEINRFTRGDTPVWFGKSDEQKLRTLFQKMDKVDQGSLSFQGHDILQLAKAELIAKLNLTPDKEQEGVLWYRKGDILVKFEKEELVYLGIEEPDEFIVEEKELNKLQISNIKETYPNSYDLRNYYGDSYLINFDESNVPDTYDYVVIKIKDSNKFLGLRYVDEHLKYVEISENSVL